MHSASMSVVRGSILAFMLLLLLHGALSAPQRNPVGDGKLPTGYIEYLTSTGLNVVLAAGHGGSTIPNGIGDRGAGCWVNNNVTGYQCVWNHNCGYIDVNRCLASPKSNSDMFTDDLTRELRLALCARFGKCPATIINKLMYTKMDPDYELDRATFGVKSMVEAYEEFHRYINIERNNIQGRGLFIDIHDHDNALQVTELGYLITSEELNSASTPDPQQSSIRSIAEHVGGDFDSLLRGPRSFGHFLEAAGFAAVPSPSIREPGTNSYSSGGYITRTHGSLNGGNIDSIQLAPHSLHIKWPARETYVLALVDAIAGFLEANYS